MRILYFVFLSMFVVTFNLNASDSTYPPAQGLERYRQPPTSQSSQKQQWRRGHVYTPEQVRAGMQREARREKRYAREYSPTEVQSSMEQMRQETAGTTQSGYPGAPQQRPGIRLPAQRSLPGTNKPSMPSIEEMKDPSKPWGLNLQKVNERYSIARRKSLGNDITNSIVNYPNTKALRERLEGQVGEKKREILKLRQRIGRGSGTKMSTVLDELSNLAKKSGQYDNILENVRKRLMRELDLTPEQVEAIPPRNAWPR